MGTCSPGPGEVAAPLPLAFLKNRGFGEEEASNFTKSLWVLSCFLKGLSAPPLPCVQRGETGVTSPRECRKRADTRRDPLTSSPQAPRFLFQVCKHLAS